MTALCLTLSPSGEGVDLKTAQKNFNAAQARHDKENATLERLQEQQADKPSDALATKVEAAEVAMQSAVEALEHAEEALARGPVQGRQEVSRRRLSAICSLSPAGERVRVRGSGI